MKVYWSLERDPHHLLLRVDTEVPAARGRRNSDGAPVLVAEAAVDVDVGADADDIDAVPPGAPPLSVASLVVCHRERRSGGAVWTAAIRAAATLAAVEQLELQGEECGLEDNADAVRTLLARLPQLRRVYVDRRAVWHARCMHALSDGLDACGHLEELKLDVDQVTNECVAVIAGLVQRVAARGVTIDLTLQTYGRYLEAWTERKVPLAARAPFQALFNALATADHLRRLDIAVPNMSSVPVAALVAALARATRLESVELHLADRPADAGTWISGGAAAAAAAVAAAAATEAVAARREFTALRSFMLQASPSVTSSLYPTVAHILGHAPMLVSACLAELDDAVAGGVAEALSRCAGLKWVRLSFRAPAGPPAQQTTGASLYGRAKVKKVTLVGAETPVVAAEVDAAGTATVVTVARLLCSPRLPSLYQLWVSGGRRATAADVAELADLVLHAPLLADVQFWSARGTDGALMDVRSATLKQHTAWSSRRRREMVLLADQPAGKAAHADQGAGRTGALPPLGLPLSELPYELLLHILTFLTPADLVLCRRVARAWRAAVRELEDRDRPLWFACGRPDMPEFPDNRSPRSSSYTTPCSCGDVLVASGDLELLWDAPRRSNTVVPAQYGDRHMSRFPPARWSVLAPLRAAAVDLARVCSHVDPHWLQLSFRCAGGRWAPAWVHVPSAAVRPTTFRGVRNLIEGLLYNAPHGPNHMDWLWQQLSDSATAHMFYTKQGRLPRGLELDGGVLSGALSDDWRAAWTRIHADGGRDSGGGGRSESDDGDAAAAAADDPRDSLRTAFEAAWPQYKLATVGTRLHALCDEDGGWGFLAFAARRSAALWRYARVSGRTDAVREHLDDSRMREFGTVSDDALTAELDAVVVEIDALSARIRKGLRLTCAIRDLDRQAWWLGGLSPEGHLVGTLCLVLGR